MKYNMQANKIEIILHKYIYISNNNSKLYPLTLTTKISYLFSRIGNSNSKKKKKK